MSSTGARSYLVEGDELWSPIRFQISVEGDELWFPIRFQISLALGKTVPDDIVDIGQDSETNEAKTCETSSQLIVRERRMGESLSPFFFLSMWIWTDWLRNLMPRCCTSVC